MMFFCQLQRSPIEKNLIKTVMQCFNGGEAIHTAITLTTLVVHHSGLTIKPIDLFIIVELFTTY